jgi:hypothetical protein
MERIGMAMLAVLATAGCHRVFGLDFDHPDAPPGDAIPDAAKSAYAEAVLDDRPIGYWRFSANTASAIDLAGQAPGVYTGNAAPAAMGPIVGEDDAAVALDGDGDFVDMGNRFGFPGTTPFTLEAWVNPTVNGEYTGVISKDDEGPGGFVRSGYHLYCQGGAFGFERNNGTMAQDVRTAPLMTGRWTHVAVVYDGASISLYTDGVQHVNAAAPNVELPATTNAFIVGGRDGGAIRWLTGAVDEVAVYDKPLTQAQLAAHRLVGLGQ